MLDFKQYIFILCLIMRLVIDYQNQFKAAKGHL